MTKITGTPELYGALVSKLSNAAVENFIEDPHAALNYVGVETTAKVTTAMNSGDVINLALPYYSAISTYADSVSDADMSGATGAGISIAISNDIAQSVSATLGRIGDAVQDIADAVENGDEVEVEVSVSTRRTSWDK